MEIPARVLVERIARYILGGCDSGAMYRNLGCNGPSVAGLLLRELAVCAFAVVFSAAWLPAQQSQTDTTPGWPLSNPDPNHGHTSLPGSIPDLKNSDAFPASESCSVWVTARVQGPTVSAVRLQVPAKARTEYGKGCSDLKGKKLASAEEHLRKAVQDYPQYVDAWVLLGQVLEAANRLDEARSACSQASTVDSDYAPAYLCLADVAGQRAEWSHSLDLADRALALVPTQDVYGYFYSAMAQFHLSQLPEAERNALQTIEADHLHRVPQAHLLLAQIYGAKHDLYGAANELRAYLKVAPNSPDSAGVRKSLAELESHTPK